MEVRYTVCPQHPCHKREMHAGSTYEWKQFVSGNSLSLRKCPVEIVLRMKFNH